MDLESNRFSIRVSQGSSSSLPPMQSNNNNQSAPNFPIIAIAVIGIVATAFLLVSYYVFVIKCCLNWHSVDVLSRFSLSRRRRWNQDDDALLVSTPAATEARRGLDEAAIRSIPILNFKNRGNSSRGGDYGERGFCECAVCLNEFQEDERLRFIPQCGHVFHIDCIDIWLQNNANCPLCRTSVSGGSHLGLFDLERISPCPDSVAVRSEEEDYVVIELGEPSSTKPVQVQAKKNKKKKMMFQTSMGDEVICNVERIQPIRRSFSMDSAADRQLFLAVEEIMQHKKSEFHHLSGIVSPGGESCSSSTRIRRTFFSFGHGRVQPLCLEP